MEIKPGTYYVDILEDGSQSAIREKFPRLLRTSFDKRPPVVKTYEIVITELQLGKTDQLHHPGSGMPVEPLEVIDPEGFNKTKSGVVLEVAGEMGLPVNVGLLKEIEHVFGEKK